VTAENSVRFIAFITYLWYEDLQGSDKGKLSRLTSDATLAYQEFQSTLTADKADFTSLAKAFM